LGHLELDIQGVLFATSICEWRWWQTLFLSETEEENNDHENENNPGNHPAIKSEVVPIDIRETKK
jgi:hypothetical protein